MSNVEMSDMKVAPSEEAPFSQKNEGAYPDLSEAQKTD